MAEPGGYRVEFHGRVVSEEVLARDPYREVPRDAVDGQVEVVRVADGVRAFVPKDNDSPFSDFVTGVA